ncbi:MAG: 30S ribosomal protein S19 [Candidatus Woesearchaeota archaeon]
MPKEFIYRGKKLDEIRKMDLKDFIQLLPARERRKMKRGLTEQEKIFLENLRAGEKEPKTHCRDLVVMPEMLGKLIRIYNGKEYVPVSIEPEMLGHRLGEFAQTRKKVSHSAPGIGATRSSASLSVR